MDKKPMLASDWDENKVRFPVYVQPKIDGVRALNISGRLTGRSLKEHKNIHVTEKFSKPYFVGFDGEMIAGNCPNADALCRNTTSALNTIQGAPEVSWYVFDLLNLPQSMPYNERYYTLVDRVEYLRYEMGMDFIHLVPCYTVISMDELLSTEEYYAGQGYEGLILRNPVGLYKSGRSTVREGGLLRVKRFVEEEAYVIRILEGETNMNEAKKNELGHTERSTHQENMVPNGMVGAMICKDIKSGQEIKVAAGCMTHDERRNYFLQQEKLIGKIIKYKCFPRGVKDAPRFPTFQSIRADSDI